METLTELIREEEVAYDTPGHLRNIRNAPFLWIDKRVLGLIPTIGADGFALFAVLLLLQEETPGVLTTQAIATALGWHAKTVKKYLKVLEEAGLLTEEF